MKPLIICGPQGCDKKTLANDIANFIFMGTRFGKQYASNFNDGTTIVTTIEHTVKSKAPNFSTIAPGTVIIFEGYEPNASYDPLLDERLEHFAVIIITQQQVTPAGHYILFSFYNDPLLVTRVATPTLQQETPVTHDPVNHPIHYNTGNIEVIDFIEDKMLSFHLGNAIKYIARAGKKDPDKYVEDLKKAAWYLNRQIEISSKL